MLLAGFKVSREFAEGTKEYREKRKKAIIEELKKVPLEDLGELYDFYGDPEEYQLDIRAVAIDAVEEAFNNLDSRDVTVWYNGKVAFFFTGGMSWGDSPTDSYDSFQQVSLLPDKILKHLLS